MIHDPSHQLPALVPSDDDEYSEELALLLDRYLQQLEQDGVPPDIELLVAEHPHLESGLREFTDGLQALHRISSDVRNSVPNPPQETPGRLGDYKILREIGRGGMGVVYEAQQISLNRKVALKVLPFAAVLDEKQIARFRNEAQAAASLHHPNIVPVYGVGDERGVHFYAMQYVAGQPLNIALEQPTQKDNPPSGVASTFYGQDNSTDIAFTTRATGLNRSYCESVARLGVQVARALSHAHDSGVIHRDVKPSNLLLDREGKVWVTDFGLARVDSNPSLTLSGDLVGTLRYMSPEQARGKPAPIDARTDIYSLGVTLYELLTGSHAHPADNRHDLLHQIEEVEPTSPRRLNPSLPFDLETIVLRAIAKSRDDRYESAAVLAEDLERFLTGHGPHARRLSPVDRMTRWAARNRTPVMVATLGVAMLAVLSTVGWITYARMQRQTSDALAIAESHLETSNKYFHQARDAVDRFGIELSDHLAAKPETEFIRRQLLEESLKYYEEFIRQAGDDASLKRELAATTCKAAGVAERLGLLVPATKRYQEATDLYNSLIAEAPQDQELLRLQADCLHGYASCLASQDRSDESFAKYRLALGLAENLDGETTPSKRPRLLTADILCDWGLLLARTGRAAEGQAKLREAIQRLQLHAADSVNDASYWPTLAAAYNNLSYIQREQDWQAALESNSQALDLLRKLVVDTDPASTWGHELAMCLNNRGAIQGHLGDWEAAATSHRESVDRLTQLVRIAPSVVAYRRDLAVGCNNLGQTLASLDRADEAMAAFATGQQQLRQLVQDYPQTLAFQSLLAGLMNNRALIEQTRGNRELANEQYAEAIRLQSLTVAAAPEVVEYRTFLDKHLANYSRCLQEGGQLAEAAEATMERLDLKQADGDSQLEMARQLASMAHQLEAENEKPNQVERMKKAALSALADAKRLGCQSASSIPSSEQQSWQWLLSGNEHQKGLSISMSKPTGEPLVEDRVNNP